MKVQTLFSCSCSCSGVRTAICLQLALPPSLCGSCDVTGSVLLSLALMRHPSTPRLMESDSSRLRALAWITRTSDINERVHGFDYSICAVFFILVYVGKDNLSYIRIYISIVTHSCVSV